MRLPGIEARPFDPELTSASVGQIWMGAQFEGSLNRVPTLAVTDETLEWVERYLKLAPGMWNVVDIAIDGLNLARRRASLGDKAIEGAICLESLLGDDSSQEFSYRLKLRAALLLGSTVAERKEIRDAVGKFYTLRSKIVHGRTPTTMKAGADGAAILKGLEICGCGVQAVVRMNRKPEPSEWELVGGIRIRVRTMLSINIQRCRPFGPRPSRFSLFGARLWKKVEITCVTHGREVINRFRDG